MRVLTSRDEEKILKSVQAKALKECHDYLLEYADCCRESFLKITFACKKPLNQLNHCLKPLTNTEKLDIARWEYIDQKLNELSSTQNEPLLSSSSLHQPATTAI